MRVAIVMRGESVAGGGGAERRFTRLFQYLRKDCHIHLIANSNLLRDLENARLLERSPSNNSDTVSDNGNRNSFGPDVHEYNEERKRNVFNLIAYNMYVIKRVRALDIDVVHLPLLQKSLLPFYVWLYFNPSIKVVHTVALSWFAYRTKLPKGLLWLAKLLWRRANAIDSLYEGFSNSYGVAYQHKVTVTPCSFTNTDAFMPSYPKDKVIVFAGRLIPEKNPLLLVQALALLKRQDPAVLCGWQVYILGQGPMERVIRANLQSAGLDDVVSVSHVASTGELLGRSRIFASLQETENYPSQSLLEAMSAGNAIVATDVGETRRLIDTQTGLLVRKGDPYGLASALKMLMSDDAKCYKLGAAARERVVAQCSLSRFAEYMKGVWFDAKHA